MGIPFILKVTAELAREEKVRRKQFCKWKNTFCRLTQARVSDYVKKTGQWGHFITGRAIQSRGGGGAQGLPNQDVTLVLHCQYTKHRVIL